MAKSSKKQKVNTKSATMMSIEKQKKLGDTVSLASLTAELPIFSSNLDAPDRRLIKSKKSKKKDDKKKVTKKVKRSAKERILNFVMDHRILCALLFLLIILSAVFVIVVNIYTVDTVLIEGNVHYSNEEIYNFVLNDRFSKSSLYLSMKYKNKDIEDIPFIQTMSVKIVNPSTIKISVYEKAMAGFVENMGRYFYFDKDGTVVESSESKTKGIPQIMGLSYDHIVLYERLPVENEDIFKQILEVTQLLKKHELEVDKIYFDSNLNITLYFDDARIQLGDFTNIDEKIIRLKAILPSLDGEKGVLRLENYTSEDSIVTFEKDK